MEEIDVLEASSSVVPGRGVFPNIYFIFYIADEVPAVAVKAP